MYDYHKKNLVELYKNNPFDAVIDSRGGELCHKRPLLLLLGRSQAAPPTRP